MPLIHRCFFLEFMAVFFLNIYTSSILASSYDVSCVGDLSAKRHIIFLRGITPDIGPEENWRLSRFRPFADSLYHRDIFFPKEYYDNMLNQIGLAYKINFAVVESPNFCRSSSSQLCWAGDKPGAISLTYENIVKSSSKCFATRDDFSFELLGFSNGGYHVARVVMQCLSPKPLSVIAIGSAGDSRLAASKDLSACTRRMILAVGDRDITWGQAKTFVEEMRKRHMNVALKSYYGGHELSRDLLENLLNIPP